MTLPLWTKTFQKIIYFEYCVKDSIAIHFLLWLGQLSVVLWMYFGLKHTYWKPF